MKMGPGPSLRVGGCTVEWGQLRRDGSGVNGLHDGTPCAVWVGASAHACAHLQSQLWLPIKGRGSLGDWLSAGRCSGP